MSALMDFLLENPIDDVTSKVMVSERLKAHPFTIKAMAGPEFDSYSKSATKIHKGKKVDFNSGRFNEMVVINHTVDPNFKDADFIKRAGCMTPEQLMYKTLLSGEIAELTQKIASLSGFDQEMDELVEEGKNS